MRIVILSLILLSLAGLSAAFAGGNGSQGNPYLIANCTDLQNMSSNLSASYALNNSIDCSGFDYNSDGKGFMPIGNYSDPFTGTFDGRNFTISNLYINRPEDYDVGLFDYVGDVSPASISNIGLINASITGGADTGGLIGESYYSNISNSYVTGSVTANGSTVGGLIAGSYQNNISNSYATGSVNENSKNGYAGGLIGDSEGDIISNCHATGSVNGNNDSNNVGGLIGTSAHSNISNSYATGNVTGSGSGDDAGGLIGTSDSSTISNVSATGNVIGNVSSDVGGLIGESDYSNISKVYATGSVTGDYDVGGLIGVSNSNTINNSYATGNVTGSGSSDVGGLIGFSDGDNISNSYASGSANGGDHIGGLLGGSYQSRISYSFSAGNVIPGGSSNYGGFVGYDNGNTLYSSNYWDTYLSGQVNCTGAGGSIANCTSINTSIIPNYFYNASNEPLVKWDFTTPIWYEHPNDYPTFSPFGVLLSCSSMSGSGTTNDPYMITACCQLQNMSSNLSASYALNNTINCTGFDYGDLMGFMPVGNSSVQFTGTFDGANFTISNLYINRSQDYVGLFGYAANASISNIGLINASISGNILVGGLLGNSVYDNVTNAYVIGNITGTGDMVGGLLGDSGSDTISNTYAIGSATGSDYVGGLIGLSGDDNISNAYATGNVTGTGTDGCVGGLIGCSGYDTISNAYATGSATGSIYVGGLLGASGHDTISNAHATGSAAGYGYVGGLIGQSRDDNISNAYATGNVTGNYQYVGGLIGWSVFDNISKSYATGSATGSSQSGDIYEVGGLIGYSEYNNISNAYATGSATGSSQSGDIYDVGGLIGYSGLDIINNTYAAGSATGSSQSGDIYDVGGLIGEIASGTISNLYWDINRSGQENCTGAGGSIANCTGKDSDGNNVSYFYKASNEPMLQWDFTTPIWYEHPNDYPTFSPFGVLLSCSSMSGSGTTNDPYMITACCQLQNMSSNLSASYALNNSIDCSGFDYNSDGKGFMPISNYSDPFTGTFDGRNFTISNLYINRPEDYDVGLFDYVGDVSPASISNIGLINASITGGADTGGLIGESYYSNISNSYVTGSVNGNKKNGHAGGLIGESEGDIISNCYVTGSVNGNNDSNNVGGLIGNSYFSNISNSYATGSVNGNNKNDNVGGLIGNSYFSNISNSYVTGNVTGNVSSDVGGLIGSSDSSNIFNSYATGNVTGNVSSDVGGLIGSSYFSNISKVYTTGSVTGDYDVGGLIGQSFGNTINNSYTTGNVNSAGNTGGLIGLSDVDNISNSYASGSVSGSVYVGGLIGLSYQSRISYSFSAGNVITGGGSSCGDVIPGGGSSCGGFVGYDSGNTLYSNPNYWDTYLSGQVNCTGIGGSIANCTGKDSDGSNISYFYKSGNSPLSSWDFTTPIWYEHNVTYPNFTAEALPPVPLILVYFISPTTNTTAYTTQTWIAANATVNATGTIANLTIWLYNSTGLYNSSNADTSPLFINWTGLPDGLYYFNATAYDAATNTNKTETRNMTIDATNPTITFSAPTTNTTAYTNLSYISANVSANDTNMANITIYLYNSTGLYNSTTSPLFINWTGLPDGLYYFNATAYDDATNTNKTETRGVTIDTQAPIVTMTSPSGIINSNSFALSFTLDESNPDSCWYSLDNGTDVALPNCTGRAVSSSYGGHCVAVYANDTAGNLNSGDSCFVLRSTNPPSGTHPLHLSVSVACVSNTTGNAIVIATSFGGPVSSVDLEISNIGESTSTDSSGKGIFLYLPDGSFTVSGIKGGYSTAQTAFSVSCQQNISINATPSQPNITLNQTINQTVINQTVKNQTITNQTGRNHIIGNQTINQTVINQTVKNQTTETPRSILGGMKITDIVLQAMNTIVSLFRSLCLIILLILIMCIGWYIKVKKKWNKASR